VNDVAHPRPAQEEPCAIRLEGVSKSYGRAGQFAIRDIDLSIARGSFVAMVGQSGSGKTTLLKSTTRLVEPDDGAILIDGEPAHARPAHELRRHIGYVFQGIGLFPHLSVAENIGVTPDLLGWPRAEIAGRVAELLDLVELPADFGARMPAALSGGQRQRVGIARALAARPEILLMDEPFGALDPVTRETLGSACRRLHDRLGLTTVMVTHDIFEAVLLADRIVVLREGGIVADDTPRALLVDPPDGDVRSLMAMPLRQAKRVRALLDGGPQAGAA
jgi:osmoprotectant transport system ATP-binding protein